MYLRNNIIIINNSEIKRFVLVISLNTVLLLITLSHTLAALPLEESE